MNCINPDCGENTLVTELTPQGLKRKCCKCGAPAFIPEQSAQQHQAPIVSAPARVAAVATKKLSQLTTKSLVRDARARIVDLNREIKHLKSLTKERDELKRLLKAAKQKPLDGGAVVRPLRKQG
jgi:hypothetical protein